MPSKALVTLDGGVRAEVDVAHSKGAEELVTAAAERASPPPPGGAVALTQLDSALSVTHPGGRCVREGVPPSRLPLAQLLQGLRRDVVQAKRQQQGRGAADLAVSEQAQGVRHTLGLSGLLQPSRAVSPATPRPPSRLAPPPEQAAEVAVVPGSKASTNLACATVTATVGCPEQDGVHGEAPLKGAGQLELGATAQGRLDELGDIDMSVCVGADELLRHVKEHDAWAVKALEHSELVDGLPTAGRLTCRRRR